MSDKLDIEELERLWEASTQGEWIWDEPPNWKRLSARLCTEKYEPIAQVQLSGWPRKIGLANTAFIAAAHNSFRALLARVRDAESVRDQRWQMAKDAEAELRTARQSIQRLRDALKRSYPMEREIDGVLHLMRPRKGVAELWTDAEIDALIERGRAMGSDRKEFEGQAQIVIDTAVRRVREMGFGVVADGTVHGNGIWIDALRVVPVEDRRRA